jgi:hypothetical protein
MVQAWYMDESADDPWRPHHAEPDRPVSLEQLRRLGVLYWKVGHGKRGPERGRRGALRMLSTGLGGRTAA